MSIDYDAMPWLVTTDSGTYGPLDKTKATALRNELRSKGEAAQAWAAQAPDLRIVRAATKGLVDS